MEKITVLLFLIIAPLAAAQSVPEIANRYELSGYADRDEPKADPKIFTKGTTLPQVRKMLLNPAESDLLKAEAVDYLNFAISDVYANSRGNFWDSVDQVSDVFDDLFALPAGSASRRHSIATIFGTFFSLVRYALLDNPDDPQWRSHWDRARGVVERGRADQDGRLKEFFDRFIAFPKNPDWRAVKAKMKKIQSQAIASHPEDKEAAEKLWNSCQQIETAQLGVQAKSAGKIKAKKLGAGKERRLLRFQAHITEYRLYMTWASLYPSYMRDLLGAKTSDELNVMIAPVKIGWPEY